jgi:hypothetical protein
MGGIIRGVIALLRLNAYVMEESIARRFLIHSKVKTTERDAFYSSLSKSSHAT